MVRSPHMSTSREIATACNSPLVNEHPFLDGRVMTGPSGLASVGIRPVSTQRHCFIKGFKQFPCQPGIRSHCVRIQGEQVASPHIVCHCRAR